MRRFALRFFESPLLSAQLVYQEKSRLVDAYQTGVIELAELAERRQRLSEQGQLLRTRVEEIEQQRLDRSAELRLLEGVDAFCASIRDAMAAPSFEVKQKVLQLVLQRIVVEDHRLIIEHMVPSGPFRLQPERLAAANLSREWRRQFTRLASRPSRRSNERDAFFPV